MAEAGRWSETGSMAKYRKGFNVSSLTDGRVMSLSGYNPGMGNYEIFDPATGTWSAAKALPNGQWHSLAQLLPDGNVVFGVNWGWYLWDAGTDSWTTSSVDPGWAVKHAYTLLRNGDLLGAYGSGKGHLLYHHAGDAVTYVNSSISEHSEGIQVILASGNVLQRSDGGCERYNVGSRTWASTGGMRESGRRGFVGVLLAPEYGSKVLVAGGSWTTTSELYDEGANTWSYTGGSDLTYEREVPTMILLPDGKALMIGTEGWPHGKTCELYDPPSESWSMADQMKYIRSHYSSVILHTGKPMAIGSFDDSLGSRIPEIYDPSDGYWEMQSSLATARAFATVTLLPIVSTTNCSTNVLISGGKNAGGVLNTCELHNYTDNTTSYTGTLGQARSHHTAVPLPTLSGEVLAAGGKDNGGTALSSCELYNLQTESWSPSGALANARFDHTGTPLANGKILVTGGEGAAYLSTCEMHSGGTWTGTGSLTTARARHSAVLMLDTDVLVIGGETASGVPTVSCEIWNGTSWAPAAPLNTARSLHTATLLQSGYVLVVGGRGAGGVALSSCEIYNPATGVWTQEENLSTARYAHNATLLYSGLVLVTGGWDGSTYYSSNEIWDPGVCDPWTGTHEWKTVPGALTIAKAYHGSVLIPADKPYILAIGGYNGSYSNSIERFDVGLGYMTSWQSTITNHPAITDISSAMHIEGTLFRGISEADGGNHCHVGCNDRPIISLVRAGGGNWQGNGGGEILYMPRSTSWNSAHTDVSVQVSNFAGFFRLWSIVNGIPCKWYDRCLSTEESQQSTVYGPRSIVYPNPSTSGSGVHFRFGLSTVDYGLSTIAIYDLTGRLVRSVPIHDSPLTIHGLTPGIYFYKINCHSDPELASGLSESITGKFTIVE
jgi:hypothetical protein